MSDSAAGGGEATDGDNEELIAKRTTSVPVWKYFGFEADESGNPLQL